MYLKTILNQLVFIAKSIFLQNERFYVAGC